MTAFRFKQFSVEHDRSSMKVGTDGVLLGVAADVGGATRVLDAGTGCGVIALILAQRCSAKITAIDIDKLSVEEAAVNFRNSPWADRLVASNDSLQAHALFVADQYDAIVSNPPFFQNSLKNPDKKKTRARHNDDLPFDEFLESSARLLKPEGSLWVILPLTESQLFQEIAQQSEFFTEYRMLIHPKPGRAANRVILKFTRKQHRNELVSDSLTIRNEDDTFTEEYQKLTADFYLEF